MFVVSEGRIQRFIAFVCCILLFDLFFCLLLFCFASLCNFNSLSHSLFFCVSFLVVIFFSYVTLSKFLPFLIIILSIGSLLTSRLIRPKFSPCCSTVPETKILLVPFCRFFICYTFMDMMKVDFCLHGTPRF